MITYTTLITATQLQQQRQAHWLLIDVRFDLMQPEWGYQQYCQQHIPGAFYWHLDKDLSGKKTGQNGRHPLPNTHELHHRLLECGLHSTTQVVVYDAQNGMFAARLWWLLRWLGHESVAVLDGGWQAWLAEGGELSHTLPNRLSPLPANPITTAPPLCHRVVTVNEVVANLDSRQFLVIDARAPDRFQGDNETLDPVGGHIPGAINRFFKDNLQANGQFKEPTQLRAEWLALLNQPATPTHAANVIHQCGSGVTACHNVLAMEIAGLGGSRLYAGSWSEWCADLSRPVSRK